ncbi:MgtC/SapB family protein [Bacteriovorax sp. Seq25_V]|uniref:MgtC/SapB family protein n=1 Tax=Bacteriovorax sp. Seq25_V TaxID=1201288 RepID=UPI00038A13E9|nr:MgtC/SapB family protein [Bacteriovorax sp. Seq25_V]EQC46337.1 Mg2+ transporter-C, MgtC family [Bacteriovorax sp. Seq25_V]
MKNMYIEFFGFLPLYIALGIKIVTALILGGLVGLDREQKMKSAGIKTNMLICLGATVYTALSILSIDQGIGAADPNRVAAQIVSGIGFLGAGAIIHGRGGVVGLTTAATIWVVAAIGVTIGYGYPIAAGLITITILIVLRMVTPLYKLFESEKHFRRFHVEVLSQGRVKGMVKEIVYNRVDQIDEIYEEMMDVDNDIRLLHVYLKVHPRRIPQIQKSISSLIKVDKVKIHEAERTIDHNNEESDE